MHKVRPHTNPDELFGALPHDAEVWQRHPMVAKAAIHFESDDGWIEIWLREVATAQPSISKAIYVDHDVKADSPDLYFWGEMGCPVALFEHMPRLHELRVFAPGPVEGESRDWWSAGLWLNPNQVS